MKNLCLILFMSLCLQGTFSITFCSDSCLDKNGFCRLMKNQCHKKVVKVMCLRTCDLCQPCSSALVKVEEKKLPCEFGTCKDRFAPSICFLWKARVTFGCKIVGQYCRQTCGLCRECKLPPTEIACTADCSDNNESCYFWKKQGYCSAKKGFPDTLAACPLSCGLCKPCPKKKELVLPPTEEESKKSE